MPTPLRVLIVEDSEDDAHLLLRELRRGGYEPVHRRVDTSDGMRSALEEDWDVIFSDYSMPEFSTPAALKLLQESGKDIPLLVVSGTIGEERAVEIMKAGARDFVIKGNLLRLNAMVAREVAEAQERSARRVTENALQKLSRAVEQTADSVFITDMDGRIEYVNPAFERTTGYSREEVLGEKASLLKSGKHDDAFYRRLWTRIRSGNSAHETFINRRKDGSYYYEEKVITPLTDGHGQITHFVSTGRDITDRVNIEALLKHQSTHDPVTNLPNRLLIEDRLKQALRFCESHQCLVSVLFIDLDNFKRINDAFGHENGDQLLQAIADRLNRCISENDTLGRFGGDEFVIVAEALDRVQDLQPMLSRIQQTLEIPFSFESQEVFVTCSIGIALSSADGQDCGTLLKNAEAAMYHVKGQGKNGYQFYAPAMNDQYSERLNLEASLRHALRRDEFVLHYQPQIDLKTGKMVAVEALLRWQHPDRGLISPGEFIPVLEETGLITSVGEWVLDTACRTQVAWIRAGYSPLIMSVNLSGRQFYQADLVHKIQGIVLNTGIDSAHLELEITESVIMSDWAASICTLSGLSDMGVTLAVDDFGTGYSSLSYLTRFPINTLKVDYSFVRKVTTKEDAAAVASAILSLAKSLNLVCVAEGIETPDQLAFFASRDCGRGQGFYFSRPVPASHIEKLMAETGGDLSPSGL